MRISAITVCFNSAPVLARALGSLRAQSWPDVQMVVIDGGSSDTSVSIARGFERRGDVIVSEPDSGIYNAMNKGLAAADGDLIYFLNSDDCLYDPGVFADVAALAQHSSAAMLVGDVQCVGEGVSYRKAHAHIRRWNILQERICHQAAFVRRSAFAQVGGFDEQYRICADHEFFVRALMQGLRLQYLPRLIAEFTLGGTHARQRQIDVQESAHILARYQRPIDVPRLLAYRAVRKLYRTATGHWLDRRG